MLASVALDPWLVPLLLGHLVIFIAAVNVLHGLGRSEAVMAPVKVVMAVAFGLSTLGLAWQARAVAAADWPWPARGYAALCAMVALGVFPATSAYLRLRRTPPGIVGGPEAVEVAGLSDKGSLIGDGRHAWLLRLPGNESTGLRKSRWVVEVGGLHPALDGLSILHVSDFHFTRSFDRRYFERVADAAAADLSDLVLFTGDLIDDRAVTGWVVTVMSRMPGRVGAYAVLGNHDIDHHPDEIRQALREAGFTDVEGRWEIVKVGGATVALAGTSAPWGPPVPSGPRPPADLHVLLSHSPDQFHRAARQGFDLMFAGHNHGGQVRLPLVGPVFMPSVYSRRFDRGFFRKGGLTLHVSRGVSGKHPLRYNCPPEVSRIVLRRVGEEGAS